MKMAALIALHRRRPFQPFDIHLADGRVLPINEPACLGRAPKGRTIAIGLAGGVIEVVDMKLVSSLRPRKE